MASDDCLMDYVIRAETAANSLKTAGETISDSIQMAMVLKGLQSEFKTFTIVVTQKETQMTFTDFKVSLRNFEGTEKCQRMPSKSDDSVMKAQQKDNQTESSVTCYTCYTCRKPGHKSYECRFKDKKDKRWCNNCKSNSRHKILQGKGFSQIYK